MHRFLRQKLKGKNLSKSEKIKLVLEQMKKEHQSNRLLPVTKKRLFHRVKECFEEEVRFKDKNLFSYRTMERILKKLVSDETIINKKRGKYWLPEYFEVHMKIAEPYADLFQYCESEEDWKLWEDFRNKMLENKDKKLLAEQREAEQVGLEWEHQQKESVENKKRLEQIKKELKL